MADFAASTLLLSKTDGALKDSVEDFGVALLEAPMTVGGDAKSVYSNDWRDEDGEDAYIPARIRLKGFDQTFQFGVKSDSGEVGAKIQSFIEYLCGADGTGAELRYYSPLLNYGRSGCYYSGYTRKGGHADASGDMYQSFEVKLHVCKPLVKVTVGIDGESLEEHAITK